MCIVFTDVIFRKLEHFKHHKIKIVFRAIFKFNNLYLHL